MIIIYCLTSCFGKMDECNVQQNKEKPSMFNDRSGELERKRAKTTHKSSPAKNSIEDEIKRVAEIRRKHAPDYRFFNEKEFIKEFIPAFKIEDSDIIEEKISNIIDYLENLLERVGEDFVKKTDIFYIIEELSDDNIDEHDSNNIS